MTGKEAIQALKDGKKLKRRNWDGKYVYFNFEKLKLIVHYERTGECTTRYLDVDDYNDWEVYYEDKQN